MKDKWDLIIRPKNNILNLNFSELWQYRDLLSMFVRRDIVTVYKQTILGPIWYFIQPLLTMLVYVVVFANIAGISTDGIPQALFYLSGIIIWNYFSECFMQTSDTFSQNQDMFGKVYFPRLILPLSKVVSGLIKFFIQFLLFLGFYVYFLILGTSLSPNLMALLFVPLLLIQMAALGLGFGLIFTSLTTKYRDLKFLVQFGVQLLMYATPIIYPISAIPEKFKFYILLNPLSHIVETFKMAFLGKGEFLFSSMIYSICFTIVTLLVGIFIFNRTERSFMDTV